jgi:cobalt-zinc-cadmium efflux system membrane fusion protein
MTGPIRAAIFAASLAGAACLGAWAATSLAGRPPAEGHDEHDEHEDAAAPGVVTMAAAKQESAGVVVEPARRGDLTLTKWVTGKVAPNEDRLAHIYSLVEGTVHEVEVGYGDRVKAGDALATIDSREVGQAKLALVQNRLDAEIARVNLEWKRTIAQNARALIEALDEGIGPQDVAGRFRDRPMGKYREEIVSAYARLEQLRAEHDRTAALVARQSVSQREYEKAKADYEAAQATFNALKEQARFTTQQELIQAQQALEQARVAEGASRSALYILGYGEAEVAAMDPLGEGEEVAHHAITAPFDGTILEKDVVIEERVGPQTKLFDLADLATVWVQADLYERDLIGLADLKGRTLRFRSGSDPDRTFEAKVFYTGDVVDPETRTVRMMATAENPERRLKPGLFVEVEVPVGSAGSVVQVPRSAVQADAGETFVFVRRGPETFARRDVTLGREGPDVVEVVAGLEGGEPLAVAGAFALKAELKRGELGEGGHQH